MATVPLAVKRGAIPSSRHELAAAMPHVPLHRIPPHRLVKPARLSIWHNDQHGDCVTAEEAFAKACHHPEIFIADAEVESWAQAHGVYEGASLYGVLQAMQTGGFVQGHRTFNDGSAATVDWTNPAVLRSAIYHGPVKLGVAAAQLEATCGAFGFTRSGWFATGYQADANEDHCVALCGYGPLGWLAQHLPANLPAGADPAAPGYALFTWGSIGVIDEPALLAITHEAWLRTPTTIIVHGP